MFVCRITCAACLASLAGLLIVVPGPLAAQAVGNCPPSQGEAYLDVNGVRAHIYNHGGLFYRVQPPVYEVGGANAIYAASILIAGLINGKLHAAASRYGDREFWAGPLDNQGNPPADCERYDRLWEITRADLETYARTGIPTPNLLDWPWHLGAPVLDADHNPENYNLEAGDRPALIGDQMLWWVMNDRGNIHQRTGSLPPHDPADRVGIMATGPIELNPGERQEIAFAIVWSRGNDHLDSVRQLKSDVGKLRRHADTFLQPDTSVTLQREATPTPILGFAPAYPNPFPQSTTLRYSLPQPMRVRLVVYDMLAREVAVLVDEQQAEGIHTAEFEASGLPSGVYVARLQLDHLAFTKSLLLIR